MRMLVDPAPWVGAFARVRGEKSVELIPGNIDGVDRVLVALHCVNSTLLRVLSADSAREMISMRELRMASWSSGHKFIA
jgi:hypothetical protein